jgi:hypothetical protein
MLLPDQDLFQVITSFYYFLIELFTFCRLCVLTFPPWTPACTWCGSRTSSSSVTRPTRSQWRLSGSSQEWKKIGFISVADHLVKYSFFDFKQLSTVDLLQVRCYVFYLTLVSAETYCNILTYSNVIMDLLNAFLEPKRTFKYLLEMSL